MDEWILDELVKLFDENLEYIDHKVIEDTIYIKIKSIKENAYCRDYNTLSKVRAKKLTHGN